MDVMAVVRKWSHIIQGLRLKRTETNITTLAGVVVSLDFEGLDQIAKAYGPDGAKHASQILSRILQEEIRATDALTENSEHSSEKSFSLVLRVEDQETARKVLHRIEERFAHRLADAGYDCGLTFECETPSAGAEVEAVLARANQAVQIFAKNSALR